MAELWLQFLITRVSPRISIFNGCPSFSNLLFTILAWLTAAQSHPTMADRPLFAHQIPISVKLKLFRILNFSFCWKESAFFLFGSAPKMFFSHPFFFVGKKRHGLRWTSSPGPQGPHRGDLERFNSRSAVRLDKRLARTKSNSSRNLERDQRGPLRLGTSCWPSSNAWFHPWIGSKSTGNHRFWAPKGLKGF